MLKISIVRNQNPIKHHYVPKAYLKQFANTDAQFFQIRKHYEDISLKHISQVCDNKDYFKIQYSEFFQK